VVAMGANRIVKVILDNNGTPTINAPKQAGDPGAIIRIKTGQKPVGMAINSTGARGFVANEVSRDVTVVNLDNNQVLATFSSAAHPSRARSKRRFTTARESSSVRPKSTSRRSAPSFRRTGCRLKAGAVACRATPSD